MLKKLLQRKKLLKLHSREYGRSVRDSEVQKLADISRNTLYKYKKELREELFIRILSSGRKNKKRVWKNSRPFQTVDKTLLVSTPEAFFLFSVQKVCT